MALDAWELAGRVGSSRSCFCFCSCSCSFAFWRFIRTGAGKTLEAFRPSALA